MDPKQHQDAVWFALAGPKSGEYLASQQAQDCASEKGAYEIMPLGGEEGYYWKWVRKEEPVEEQDEPCRLEEGHEDPWIHRSQRMMCRTCMWFVEKEKSDKDEPLGRCRRHAPTMGGYPVVFSTDWCGDHKLDENKL